MAQAPGTGKSAPRNPTAAILVIGDEILSGRVQDTNSHAIARFLHERGITLKEVRVVPDDVEVIAAAVNELRQRYDYLFTTGGIGPTHDDVTVDALAKAFGVEVVTDPEAERRLRAFFRRRGQRENAARMRMARVPRGASLIDNPLSAAPGFHIGNVFVLAGVPKVMSAMLATLAPRLANGVVEKTVTITVHVPEGEFGQELAAIARRHPRVRIGSYPYFTDHMGAHIVLSGRDEAALGRAVEEVRRLTRKAEAACGEGQDD